MFQSHVNQPDREQLFGSNGNKTSSDDAGEDDDHRHWLDWRDINRVLFVATAAGAMGFWVGRQIRTSLRLE